MEKINFGVHPEIIRQFIFQQHGGISKSIIELVQNSIDARASKIDVTIKGASFSVIDNGHGFSSEEEVMTYFKIFGQPQDTKKTFARFHVGRGQILALAHTKWSSNLYEMDVDLKTSDTDLFFNYKKLDKAVPGCAVTGKWYSKIVVNEVVDDIIRECAYLDANICINGVPLNNTQERELVFSDKDLEIYYIKNKKFSSYYNHGVFICDDGKMAGYDIISRTTQFNLNTARNFIISGDKLKEKALFIIKEDRTKRFVKQKKSKWSESDRKEALEYLLDSYQEMLVEDIEEFLTYEIIKEAEGEYCTINDMIASKVINVANENEKTYIPAIVYSHKAIRASSYEKNYNNGKQMLCFIENEWAESIRFYSRWYGDAFRNILSKISTIVKYSNLDFEGVNYTPSMQKLIEPFIGSEDVYDEKDLEQSEALILRAIRYANKEVMGLLVNPRYIQIGKSKKADAWTDGGSQIFINRQIIQGYFSQEKATKIALLLLHEYAHEDESINMLDHNFNFYKRFHDYCFDESVRTNSYGNSNLLHRLSEEMSETHRRLKRVEDDKKLKLYKLTLPVNDFHSHICNGRIYFFNDLSSPAIATKGYRWDVDVAYNSLSFKKKTKEAFALEKGISEADIKEFVERINGKVHGLYGAIVGESLEKVNLLSVSKKSKYGDIFNTVSLNIDSDWDDYVSPFILAQLLTLENKVDVVVLEYLTLANLKRFDPFSGFNGIDSKKFHSLLAVWPDHALHFFCKKAEGEVF